MTDKEILELYERGMTRPQIAHRTGKTERQVRRAIERARIDPAVSDAMTAVGTGMVPSTVWIKSKTHSIQLKPAVADEGDLLARMVDAFEGIPAYEPVASVHEANGLMTIYPLYDIHAGMLAWGEETGQADYDLDIFRRDLMAGIEAVATDAEHGVIVFGGDTFHGNDNKNQTPGSGHILDVDSRFEKVVDTVVEATCNAIDYLMTRHAKLTVIVLRGNHDVESHIILKAALKQRYRNVSRVDFFADPREIKYIRHGNFLGFFHHGDKMKAERLAMIAANECKDWSAVKYRMAFTGHLHTLKWLDMPGITHVTLRAFSPADAYGANFGGTRGICAFTIDSGKGLKRIDFDSLEFEGDS